MVASTDVSSYGWVMDVVSLSNLMALVAPLVGSLVLGMLALVRYQHVDSAKTRTLMHELFDRANQQAREHTDRTNKETREVINRTSKETREHCEKLILQNFDMIRENRSLIEKNHTELSGSLGEVRERLSHMEGLLGRQLPPQPPADDGSQAAA